MTTAQRSDGSSSYQRHTCDISSWVWLFMQFIAWGRLIVTTRMRGDGKVRMRLFARGGDVRNIFGQVLCCEVISGLRWYRSWVRRPGGGNAVLVSYHTNSRFFKSPEWVSEGLDMERGEPRLDQPWHGQAASLRAKGRSVSCQRHKWPSARINTVAFALKHLYS